MKYREKGTVAKCIFVSHTIQIKYSGNVKSNAYLINAMAFSFAKFDTVYIVHIYDKTGA